MIPRKQLFREAHVVFLAFFMFSCAMESHGMERCTGFSAECCAMMFWKQLSRNQGMLLCLDPKSKMQRPRNSRTVRKHVGLEKCQ